MYYKIKDRILFRMYDGYGFISDNSMFEYKLQDDKIPTVGEKYLSESGSIMLGLLGKQPKHIDYVVDELMSIFEDVEYDDLKRDTISFFNMLVESGFLSCGETIEKCRGFEKAGTKELLFENVLDSSHNSNECSCVNSNIDFKNSLRSLHIEIASKCNERCVHCYIPHEKKTQMINSDLFFSIVSQGREMNIINVTLSGGEPLLHEDIIVFFKQCRKLDLSVNVLSNLTLLSDDMLDEMKRNPLLCVQTSIYSTNPSIHDSITRVSGSFEKTKRNLLKLKESGIPVQISCPIMKQNKDSFNDVIAFGEENNIPVAVDYVIFASYDHSKCNLVNRLSLEEIERAFDKQASGEYIDTLCDVAAEKEQLTAQDPICSICRYYICVSAEGRVFPCIGWQENVIGDLNKQSLKEIWETSEDINRLRQITRQYFPKCVKCKDRGYCNVCMMSNSNENSDADAFRINKYHCDVAALIHKKVDSYLEKK